MKTTCALGFTTLLACSSSSSAPPIVPEEAKVQPVPSSSPSPSPAPTPSAEPAPSAGMATGTTASPSPSATEKPPHPANTVADGDPPSPAPAIGGPCPSDPAWCGKSGKVAAVHEKLRMRIGKAPCTPVPTSGHDKVGMNQSQACLDGERIFVASNCIVCRLPTEERITGLVSDMTPAQLEAAQKLAGFPAKPLLTTTSAWRNAISGAQKSRPTK